MTARPVTAAFTASAQIRPEDVQSLAEQGFATLINNRPDHEEPGQPASDQIAEAAKAAGLRYVHIPVAGPDVGDAQIEAMDRALGEDGAKAFGFCRSGTRSTMLWALANAGRESPQTLIEAARDAGYDLSGLAPALQARHEAGGGAAPR